MIHQRTIQVPQACRGVGVHTGKMINLSIRPAPPDTGIVFVRMDIGGRPRILAHLDTVKDTRNATTIGVGTATVSTVEHFLAAARGMGIDNLVVDIDGPEVPIMDGSALPFVRIFRKARIARQEGKRSYLVVTKPVRITEGDKMVSLSPHHRPHLKITCTIQYSHPALQEQSHRVEFSNGTFIREISPARTYGFSHELDFLMSQGLIRGGSLKNAVVIGDSGVLNPEGLRFHDEFVRHKILDSIGDLSLLGMPVIGHLVTFKSGHSLHLKFLRRLLQEKDSWEITRRLPAVPVAGTARWAESGKYSAAV